MEKWEDVFENDVLEHMRKKTREPIMDGHFINHVKQRVPLKDFLFVLKTWKKNTEEDKRFVALNMIGLYHSMRFVILLDYLSEKVERKNE